MFNYSQSNKMNDSLRGYCVPYKEEDYPEHVNQFIRDLHESHGIKPDSILCHHKNKYNMKTGTDKGEFPGMKNIKNSYKKEKSMGNLNGKQVRLKKMIVSLIISFKYVSQE
jgi:hypothetical protein